jgi:hypothetical protein
LSCILFRAHSKGFVCRAPYKKHMVKKLFAVRLI